MDRKGYNEVQELSLEPASRRSTIRDYRDMTCHFTLNEKSMRKTMYPTIAWKEAVTCIPNLIHGQDICWIILNKGGQIIPVVSQRTGPYPSELYG